MAQGGHYAQLFTLQARGYQVVSHTARGAQVQWRAWKNRLTTFDAAFTKAVDLGNKLAGKDKEADLWDIADGLLAGAVQYWLYSRQPCGDRAARTACRSAPPRRGWPSSSA